MKHQRVGKKSKQQFLMHNFWMKSLSSKSLCHRKGRIATIQGAIYNHSWQLYKPIEFQHHFYYFQMTMKFRICQKYVASAEQAQLITNRIQWSRETQKCFQSFKKSCFGLESNFRGQKIHEAVASPKSKYLLHICWMLLSAWASKSDNTELFFNVLNSENLAIVILTMWAT